MSRSTGVRGPRPGRRTEAGDGGFVRWSRLLTGNRKERLLISGYGGDRLAEARTSPQPGRG
ncbi:hypothetical protein [Streptomyces sp. NPDC090994]|uniref:hypothetical protein n=1 Tax=Streptomyces sp. NPDC090994 TaxID=3365969 RepID=UPI0037F9BE19